MGQVDQDREAQNHEREMLRRPKTESEFRQRRSQQHQAKNGEGAGNKRTESGDAKRRACAALSSHLVTVKAGDSRRRFSGYVDQNGCRRSSIHGSVINSGEHDDGRFRSGLESSWKEQRHGPHRPDSGKNADQCPDEYSDETIEEIHRLKGDRETNSQIIQKFHILSNSQKSLGKRTPQPKMEDSVCG